MRIRKLSIALAAAAIGVLALGAAPVLGADHRDAPLTKDSPRADINDFYAWRQPNGNVTYAMTINPLTTPGDTAKLQLDPSVIYTFRFDRTGDHVADGASKWVFSGNGPIQDVTIINQRPGFPSDAVALDASGIATAQFKSSSGSAANVVTLANGNRVFVGPRDDPFFFDLAGFQNGLKFTGVDTFKGTNVTVIAIELTAANFMAINAANDGKLSIWVTTSKQDTLGNWVQIDRMGRPAINTVFIPAAKKDAFNNNGPDRDKAIYRADVKAALTALGSPAVDTLTDLLLPDTMAFDYNKPNGYLNGRAPKDDVIDISLQAITGNAAAGDGVNANDVPFSDTFPYFAPPHGGGAPLPPNTGTGVSMDRSDLNWTLPIALVVAAALLGSAGFVGRRTVKQEA
jgi:hypothetical protein